MCLIQLILRRVYGVMTAFTLASLFTRAMVGQSLLGFLMSCRKIMSVMAHQNFLCTCIICIRRLKAMDLLEAISVNSKRALHYLVMGYIKITVIPMCMLAMKSLAKLTLMPQATHAKRWVHFGITTIP